MTKSHKVVLRPTENRTDLFLRNNGVLTALQGKGFSDRSTEWLKTKGSFQHLDILSDEEIQEGDIITTSAKCTPHVANAYHYGLQDNDHEKWVMKVIASTDYMTSVNRIPKEYLESYVENPQDTVELKFDFNQHYFDADNNIVIAEKQEKMYTESEVQELLRNQDKLHRKFMYSKDQVIALMNNAMEVIQECFSGIPDDTLPTAEEVFYENK